MKSVRCTECFVHICGVLPESVCLFIWSLDPMVGWVGWCLLTSFVLISLAYWNNVPCVQTAGLSQHHALRHWTICFTYDNNLYATVGLWYHITHYRHTEIIQTKMIANIFAYADLMYLFVDFHVYIRIICIIWIQNIRVGIIMTSTSLGTVAE